MFGLFVLCVVWLYCCIGFVVCYCVLRRFVVGVCCSCVGALCGVVFGCVVVIVFVLLRLLLFVWFGLVFFGLI